MTLDKPEEKAFIASRIETCQPEWFDDQPVLNPNDSSDSLSASNSSIRSRNNSAVKPNASQASPVIGSMIQ
jgi:hypothetical protein